MAGSFSVTLSAVDNFSKTIDAVNKKAAAFGAPFKRAQSALAKFGDVSGLNRIGQSLGGMAHHAMNAFGRISEIIAPLGAISSAASVAGMYRMVASWSAWGRELGFAAQNMGIAAGGLAGLQGGARLVGLSAGTAASGLQHLGDTMFDAVGGRAPAAVVMFNTLGISFRKSAMQARSVADVMPEVADKIASIRDPFVQARIATELFGSAGVAMLPWLRQGSAGIAEYTRMATGYLHVTGDTVTAANAFAQAQTRLSLSVEGLGNRISTKLSPILSPLLTRLADWISTSPQVTTAVQKLADAVGQLGTWIAGVNWSRVGDELNQWGSAAMTVIGAVGGVKNAVEIVAGVMVATFAVKMILPWVALGVQIGRATGAVTRYGLAQTAAANSGLASFGKLSLLMRGLGAIAGGVGIVNSVDPNDQAGAFIDRDVPGASAIDNFFSRFGMGRSYAQQRQADPTSRAGLNRQPAVPYVPGAILGDTGASASQYNAMKEAVASIEGSRYDQMGGAGGRFAGRYQMGSDEIRETAQTLGVPVPSQQQFLGNPAMQERFFEAYTDAHNQQLLRTSPNYRKASAAERLAYLGYAHNQGAGGAASWLGGGPIGHDAFGTSGTAYSKAVMAAELGLPPDAAGDAPAMAQGPALAAPGGRDAKDGTVTVRLEHANAPPAGMKATVTGTNGNLGGAKVAQANLTGTLP